MTSQPADPIAGRLNQLCGSYYSTSIDIFRRTVFHGNSSYLLSKRPTSTNDSIVGIVSLLVLVCSSMMHLTIYFFPKPFCLLAAGWEIHMTCYRIAQLGTEVYKYTKDGSPKMTIMITCDMRFTYIQGLQWPTHKKIVRMWNKIGSSTQRHFCIEIHGMFYNGSGQVEIINNYWIWPYQFFLI